MPQAEKIDPNKFRSAILAVFKEKLKIRNTSEAYGVSSRRVRLALYDMEGINAMRKRHGQNELLENESHLQVTRWVRNYTGASVSKSGNFTRYELHKLLLYDITKKMKLSEAKDEFGLSNSAYSRYRLELLDDLKIKSAADARKQYQSGTLQRNQLEIAISKIEKRNRVRPTYLLPDEETLLVATAKMHALASQPQTRQYRIWEENLGEL